MGLVAAKCTQCGANIEVDGTKEAGICKYCGTAFVTEKAINNYYVTNNISAQTVNIIGASAANDFETKEHRLIVYKGTAEIVEIPSYIDTISDGAFANNKCIKKVILSNVMYIESDAFSGCTNLLEVVFNSIVSMGIGAFCDCTSLREIIVPEGTPYIMPQVFSGCSNLEYVEIPSSVSWIGDLAFKGCTSLKHVKFHSDSTRINKDTFLGCTSLDCSNMTYRYNTATSSGCYIATCVYGSYDCPQVWTLRRFRDYTLDETLYGRLFIKCYYAISPILVKWFGDTKWFRRFWRSKLDKMVANLNSKGVENTHYNDKY